MSKIAKVHEVALNDLIPYENNLRMNDSGVDAVAESIQNYGFLVPIVADKNNVIICGHTRLKAAEKLGMETVPVITAEDLTEEQVKAFRIADNRVADMSVWDNKLLLEELEALQETDLFTGFDFVDIEDLEILNELDKKPIEDIQYGITYEVLCRSSDHEKIEKIKKAWEELGGDD